MLLRLVMLWTVSNGLYYVRKVSGHVNFYFACFNNLFYWILECSDSIFAFYIIYWPIFVEMDDRLIFSIFGKIHIERGCLMFYKFSI